MNHLQAAHLRILESLPRERIRKHEQRAPESFRGTLPRGRTPSERERLHARIEELASRGLNFQQIAAELHVDRSGVSNHLKAKGLNGRADAWRDRRAVIARLLNEINPATGRRWVAREVAEHLSISRTAVLMHVRVLKRSGWKWL